MHSLAATVTHHQSAPQSTAAAHGMAMSEKNRENYDVSVEQNRDRNVTQATQQQNQISAVEVCDLSLVAVSAD